MPDKLTKTIQNRFQSSFNALGTKRDLWDECEDMFFQKLSDNITNTTKSQVFDPKLATLAIERSNRVMSQLPTGKVRGVSSNDAGAGKMMNIMLDKYVLPNANSQFDFLTKNRMVDLYSNIYGNFFSFIDWNVKANGYIGPDNWLINIRDVFPQVGAVSVEDSDFIIIRTWKPYSFFENLASQKGYKNINKILSVLKDKSGDKTSRSDEDKTRRESSEYSEAEAAKKKGYYEVLSMYERDRWVDTVSAVKDNGVFRDIKNPHENGELPVACKYALPLLDDPMGMGDFERGKTMQYTVNSLLNLYLDAVKISIFPPVLLNKDAIADRSSIKYSAAAKWLCRGNINNFATSLNVTPRGIDTFNNTYQVITAALMNMFGTTDTTTTSTTDPGFGKTPQALKMQQARENTRDNADRFYMEQYLKKVMNRMVNLLAKKMPKSLSIRLFEDEYKEVANQYPDFKEHYNMKKGELNVSKSKVGSILYDYEIIEGSTYAVDQKEQAANLNSLFGVLTQNLTVDQNSGEATSPLLQLLKQEGKGVNFGELMTRIMANSGIQSWDKIVIDEKESGKINEEMEQILSNAKQNFLGAAAALGGINETPTEEQIPNEQ